MAADGLDTQGAGASATMIFYYVEPDWFGPYTLGVS